MIHTVNSLLQLFLLLQNIQLQWNLCFNCSYCGKIFILRTLEETPIKSALNLLQLFFLWQKNSITMKYFPHYILLWQLFSLWEYIHIETPIKSAPNYYNGIFAPIVLIVAKISITLKSLLQLFLLWQNILLQWNLCSNCS